MCITLYQLNKEHERLYHVRVCSKNGGMFLGWLSQGQLLVVEHAACAGKWLQHEAEQAIGRAAAFAPNLSFVMEEV